MKRASRSGSIPERFGLVTFVFAILACETPHATAPPGSASPPSASETRPRTDAGHPIALLVPPGASASSVAPVPDDRCPETASVERRPDAPCIAADGDVIWTPAITFDLDKARLRPASGPVLDALSDLLRRHPGLRVEIEGHVNPGDIPAGSDARLDRRRASAVREALITRGIDPWRLTSKGFEGDQPLFPPTSEQGKQFNRRIVFSILPEPAFE